MRVLKRILSYLLCSVAVVSLSATSVSADTTLPYDSYNYNYRENIVFTPPPYIPDGTVEAKNYSYNGENVGDFKFPQDMFVADSGELYVADTGNNRIVVFDSKLEKVINVITGFDNNGTEDFFKGPQGVCVSLSDKVYIADTDNKRVVVLDKQNNLVSIIKDPKSEIIDSENFDFAPVGVIVDYADRVYCIAKGKTEGIMLFTSEGDFQGFYGTINVKITLWEKFWRYIASKQERENQLLFIPTEFTGIDIDNDGFVYASNIDLDSLLSVRRLNPNGVDVLKKGIHTIISGDINPDGESSYQYQGASEIVDVDYRGNGIYSLLDRNRGRIFTYDHEGNMLYVFGGLGTQEGTFNAPVSLEQINGDIVVLDSINAEIVKFKPTEYGSLINDAVSLRFDGAEEEAIGKWEEVLKLDENNELANSGIGKAYLVAGDNKTAMHYLSLGMNRTYYSLALKRYRTEVLKKNLNYILTGVLILIIVYCIYRFINRKKKSIEEGLM